MAILSASLRPDRSIAASIQTIFFSIYPAKLDPELPGISAKATAIKIGIFKQNSRFQQFETHLSIPFLTLITIADIAVLFMISVCFSDDYIGKDTCRDSGCHAW